MKKLLVLLPIVAVMAACSKKNEIPPLTPKTATVADLIGSWKAMNDTTNLTQNGQIVMSTPEDISGQDNLFTYKANGVGNSFDGSDQSSVPFTYTLSNGKLDIISNGQETDFTIITISTTQMLLRYEETNGDKAEYEDILFIKQ